MAAPATRPSTQATSTAPWRSDSWCSSVAKKRRSRRCRDLSAGNIQPNTGSSWKARASIRAVSAASPRPATRISRPATHISVGRYRIPRLACETNDRLPCSCASSEPTGPRFRHPSLEPRPHPCPDEHDCDPPPPRTKENLSTDLSSYISEKYPYGRHDRTPREQPAVGASGVRSSCAAWGHGVVRCRR
jgi:hypothetical protein